MPAESRDERDGLPEEHVGMLRRTFDKRDSGTDTRETATPFKVGDRVRGRGQQWFDGRTGRIVQEAPQFYFSRLVAFDDGGSSWMADSELVDAADSPRRSLSEDEAEKLLADLTTQMVRAFKPNRNVTRDERREAADKALLARRALKSALLTGSSSSSHTET